MIKHNFLTKIQVSKYNDLFNYLVKNVIPFSVWKLLLIFTNIFYLNIYWLLIVELDY